jgi:hypothetical protein
MGSASQVVALENQQFDAGLAAPGLGAGLGLERGRGSDRIAVPGNRPPIRGYAGFALAAVGSLRMRLVNLAC